MTQDLHVLLIDDNRSDRALILRVLRREFSQLDVREIIDAEDFEQAIAADAFNAVITDYQLGWSNGLEVLRTIKSHYPRCPVIMFTNTGNEEIAVEALQSGLDDYVLKAPNRYIRVPASLRLTLERLEAQKRAALLEIRLRGLLNQLKVGVFRSKSDGTLVESNPAFLELLGVESLAQADELNLLNTRECYLLLENLPPQQRQEQEIQLLRADGISFWALLTTALNTVEGEVVVDGLVEDITERKQTELELQQLNATLEERVQQRTAQLAAANRELTNTNQQLSNANQALEALTNELSIANQDLEEFAYSVSHDLRAPLRTIQGFTQILLEEQGEQLDPVSRDYIQRIAADAQQADTLINDLLAYSRLRQASISPQPINLSSVLASVLEQLQSEIHQRQGRIQVEEPLPVVMGNPLILTKALTNLLGNALKFVQPGIQPQVRVWAEQRGDRTRLWFEDNGIGIAKRNQQRIFTPFTRLHSEEEYPGTGIGLAIVRKGVERMGGQVGVESQPRQGSRFWIELPSAAQSL
ncbi:MAG TPA: ATP-binding protein [Waterburya sp.]|jgi:PAS domain S-box-containing protein